MKHPRQIKKRKASVAICSWDTVSADKSLSPLIPLSPTFFPCLAKLSSYVKLLSFVSFNCLISFLYHSFCLTFRRSGSRRTQITVEKETPVLSLCRGGNWKGKNRVTGEELRREMSKCLFMPNWATDEPAAISDNSLSRRKEETSMREGIGNRGTAEEKMSSSGGV